MRVLVVDDERMVRESVSAWLERQGYAALSARDGAEALALLAGEDVDCVILDLMLPDMTGEAVCRRIRETSEVPILMLTAKHQEDDLLNGFSLGADDYMTKPFSLKELAARVKALTVRWQRAKGAAAGRSVGGITVDEEARVVKRAGESVELTPIEWRLLLAFMRRKNKVFTREELIAIAFEDDFDGFDRAVDTHIKNLRRKLEDDPRNPRLIRTVYGVGYRFGGDEA